MKKKILSFVSVAMLTGILTACETNTAAAYDTGFTKPSASAGADTATEAVSASAKAQKFTEPTITEVTFGTAHIIVYDYGNAKLHTFFSNDALGDTAYIVEGENALVGIELPSFTEGLDARKEYIDTLKKPMNDIFLCNHATGASYIEGMTVYGTQGAKESIESGSAYETTQGLYESFGENFHGGADMAQIRKVVSGTITVAGMEFNLLDYGETFDLEIPAMQVIYTHMLGKTSHSILLSTDNMDSLITILQKYQTNGYDMILTAHGGPEGQDAVAEKIAYVEKTKELAAVSHSVEEFIPAMQKAFPNYTGENYLEMTARYLYQ